MTKVYMTPHGKAPDGISKRLKALKELLQIYEAAIKGTPLISNQGQALDGYSELAAYRAVLEKCISE